MEKAAAKKKKAEEQSVEDTKKKTDKKKTQRKKKTATPASSPEKFAEEEVTIETTDESEEEIEDEVLSNGDENDRIKAKLIEIWKSLSPPTVEEEIVGKWYAGIYKANLSAKKQKLKLLLYIGKAVRRFLVDKDGPASGIELECLRLHVGTSNIFESNPEHLKDIYVFPVKHIIAGPITVIPRKGNKWEIPSYPKIAKQFEIAKFIELEKLYNVNMFVGAGESVDV